MDKLEEYAKDKEQEKEVLVKVLVANFDTGSLDARGLEAGLEEVYRLGHHAGHCRGENYKTELDTELKSLPHSELCR